MLGELGLAVERAAVVVPAGDIALHAEVHARLLGGVREVAVTGELRTIANEQVGRRAASLRRDERGRIESARRREQNRREAVVRRDVEQRVIGRQHELIRDRHRLNHEALPVVVVRGVRVELHVVVDLISARYVRAVALHVG